MPYIEDMYPVRIIDLEKYFKYTAMREEREKFLKNSKYVCQAEWSIHKRLYQERFSKVYLYLGRGNGKWRAIDDYLDLLESGRDVTVMNARDAFAKPPKPDWYSYLNDRIKDKLYEEFAKTLVAESPFCQMYHVNHTEWEPIVRPDAYAYRNNYIYNNWLWGNLAYGVVKESIAELIEKGDTNENRY